jgi:hypothetical protein
MKFTKHKNSAMLFLKTDQESNYNDDALYESDNDSAPEDSSAIAEQQKLTPLSRRLLSHTCIQANPYCDSICWKSNVMFMWKL